MARNWTWAGCAAGGLVVASCFGAGLRPTSNVSSACQSEGTRNAADSDIVMFFARAGRLDRVLPKPIHGQMTARQALTMMLRGMHLVAVWGHDTAMGGDYVEVGRDREEI